MEWITDRLPTAADADEDGDVSVRNQPKAEPSAGPYFHWKLVLPGMAWCHTDIWEQENEPVPAPKPALAVGQRWRRRDGEVVTITEHDVRNETDYPFRAGSHWYRADGTSCIDDSDADLVELIEPAAEHRRFVSISRTILKNGDHILDAIDDGGDAWWMRLDTRPHHPAFPPRDPEWHQLSPLPARELPTEPEF